MRNWKYTVSVIMITIVIMAIGGILWNSGTTELKPDKTTELAPDTTIESAPDTTTEPAPDTTTEPAPDSVNSEPITWQRGNQDAPITIDEYPDLGCHICIEKEVMVLQALNAYPGKIRVIHHHYAFSAFYEKLAEALEAAGEQGKFWEFHDRLIQNVPNDMPSLLALAEAVGLDMGRFNDALDSGKYTETVKKSKEEAIARGVKEVSMFINGKEYDKSPGTLEDLYNAIDNELAKLDTNDKQ